MSSLPLELSERDFDMLAILYRERIAMVLDMMLTHEQNAREQEEKITCRAVNGAF